MNDEQERVARAYVEQLDRAHVFAAAIATRIEPGRPFFPAEAYHQNFLDDNPTNPYILRNDLPKIGELKKTFPDLFRSKAVLVSVR